MTFYTGRAGTKGININALPAEAWESLFGDVMAVGGDGQGAYTFGLKSKRASMVAAIPRMITTIGGDEIDEDALPFDINPLYGGLSALMWQIAFALHGGAAYWATEFKGRRPYRVRWLTPGSVKPKYDNGRLVAFSRQVGDGVIKWQYDDAKTMATSPDNGTLGWVWALGIQEIGPGIALDDVIELPDAVLKSSNALMNNLLSRGAVLSHFVTADFNPPDNEKERLRDKIWRTLFRGADSPGALEVFGKGLEIQQIGTPPKDLEMETVNRGNEGEISMALETPRPMATGDAANRSVLDRLTQMWVMYTIAPIADRIAYALNHHTFNPLGYHIKLQPESLTSLQEEEHQRTQSVAALVGAGETLDNAYRILGYDLPDDMEPRPERVALPTPSLPIEPVSTDDGEEHMQDESDMKAWTDEAGRFRRWYRKRLGGDVKSFDSDILSHADKLVIADELLRGDEYP